MLSIFYNFAADDNDLSTRRHGTISAYRVQRQSYLLKY